MNLEKVKHLPAKGGSIRFYFKKGKAAVKDNLTLDLIAKEDYVYTHLAEYFQATKDFISAKREKLNHLLDSLDSRSKIAAYGTSIGATVFCYQFEIEDKISCFFDDDPLRQNRFAPGSGIKVLKGRSTIMSDFSHIIILAPLYADAIIRNNLDYLKNGGKFIKFWPEVEVVSLENMRHRHHEKCSILNLAVKEREKELIHNKIDEIMTHGQIVLGSDVNEFENNIANIAVKYATGVGSGSDAVFLALSALDIKTGDEVITTSLSWITANAISLTGATPFLQILTTI